VRKDKQIIEGTLIAVADDRITIEQVKGMGKAQETVSDDIPFSDIDKTFVLISFK
jgi:ribosome maturation factor RimP